MSATLTQYYDLQHRVWFDPFDGYRRIDALQLYKRDALTILVQAVTSQYGFVPNSDGTAPDAFAQDLSALINIVLGIKTRANYAAEGAFTAAFITFDSGNAWHNPTKSRFAIPVGIVGSIAAGDYLAEYHFSTAGGSVQTFGRRPLACPIIQDVVTGTEPTPTPLPSNIGTATILDGTDSVTVTYSTMTGTGLIFPSWVGSPQGTLGAEAASGSFTIQAGGPVSGNSIVGYNVARIS